MHFQQSNFAKHGEIPMGYFQVNEITICLMKLLSCLLYYMGLYLCSLNLEYSIRIRNGHILIEMTVMGYIRW